MPTVPLKELNEHIGKAREIVDACLQSDEAQPGMSFGDLRKSLRAALKLLEGEAPSGTAADRARRSGSEVRFSVRVIFPGGGHPYRNHEA